MLFLEVFFFSFNINPIQWQWNPDNHPFHTQIRPITTTSVSICQNNFPSKEFNSYYASSTFSSVSFTISSYLLHATLTPHEIHRNRTDKAPFSSNRVLGSVWNTNRETDRSTVCTQWSSWYCLISWSMHEWFGLMFSVAALIIF